MLRRFFLKDAYTYKYDKTATNFDLFIGLRKNAAWRDYCAERFCELLSTQFSTARMLEIANEMIEVQRPEMGRQIARWGYPKSIYTWESWHLRSLLTFLRTSHRIIYTYIQQELGISNERMAELRAMYPDA